MNRPAERNHGLDLIRGLASVGVAAYHFLHWNYSITLHSLGTFGVYVFFILSAVTMMMRYESAFHAAIRADVLLAFYQNRIARLLPLLALVSLLAACWWVSRGDAVANQAARAILTATGAMGLHLPGFVSNATGAWSLGIEAVFYVVFPIVALLAARASAARCAITVVVFVAFQQAAIFLIADMPLAQFWNYYITPVIFAPFFAIGILIHKAPVSDRAANIWIALAAMIILAGYTQIFPVILWHAPVHYLIATAIAATSVAFAYRGEVPALLVPVAQFLGNISYALYLTHWFAHLISSASVRRLGLPAELHPVAFTICAILLAWSSFRFLEQPARRLLRSRLFRL